MGFAALLLDHSKEAGSGDMECTWVRIVSGRSMGWTW